MALRSAARADPPPSAQPNAAATNEAATADQFFEAIVKVSTRAVPDARSAATLGTGARRHRHRHRRRRAHPHDRLSDRRGRRRQGHRPVAAARCRRGSSATTTRPASGSCARSCRSTSPPVPLGDSAKLAERDPVMIVNYGGADDVTLAYVVSQAAVHRQLGIPARQAIFTSPPTLNWSGAALIEQGPASSLGVGSLIVREATGRRGARCRATCSCRSTC